uniref:Uncharacterized protein n=1 Tax=Acrobeloides nanus TaxID=290746 RepID=A0A914ENC2_9BILA
MNPWVASSEAVTPIHRLEHSSRRHDHFRNFDQESSQEQNRFLNSGGVPPNFIPHEQNQILPTPQNGPPSKKFEEMFDVDFPAYPPRGISDLFAGNPIRDTARCFSCMSKFYEAVWPVLSTVYKRPRNFTDRCNDDLIDPKFVPVVQCSTICVQMWEEPTVAGVKIRGHIRGCLDDLLHNGFNQTIVTCHFGHENLFHGPDYLHENHPHENLFHGPDYLHENHPHENLFHGSDHHGHVHSNHYYYYYEFYVLSLLEHQKQTMPK